MWMQPAGRCGQHVNSKRAHRVCHTSWQPACGIYTCPPLTHTRRSTCCQWCSRQQVPHPFWGNYTYHATPTSSQRRWGLVREALEAATWGRAFGRDEEVTRLPARAILSLLARACKGRGQLRSLLAHSDVDGLVAALRRPQHVRRITTCTAWRMPPGCSTEAFFMGAFSPSWAHLRGPGREVLPRSCQVPSQNAHSYIIIVTATSFPSFSIFSRFLRVSYIFLSRNK